MKKSFIKIFFVSLIIISGFLIFSHNQVSASSCDAILGNHPVFFGNQRGQGTSATQGQLVHISGSADNTIDGTLNDPASMNNIAKCLDGTLVFKVQEQASGKETIIQANTGSVAIDTNDGQKATFHGDYSVNLSPGNYQIRWVSANGVAISSNYSGYSLQVTGSQSCVFDSPVITINPASLNNKTDTGKFFKISVHIKPVDTNGACDNWSISGDVLTPPEYSQSVVSHEIITNVVKIGGIVVFTWDPNGAKPGNYRFKASMGNQEQIYDKMLVQGDQPTSNQVTNGTGSQPAPTSYTFSLDNPLGAGYNNIEDLLNGVLAWITRLSIPIAVLMIIYAGIMFLTSGQYPKNFETGKSILKGVVIGLAIIFIGKGFISLIKSIIQLKG